MLATSIAETSLTIEGVRVVIDCGLMRVPRFDPCAGMTRLDTVRVSQASADQRRGRAGRTSPGVCYRLWAEEGSAACCPSRRPKSSTPTSRRWRSSSPFWGANDATCPGSTRRRRRAGRGARVARPLGALDGEAHHAHGRAMARLGQHPRLAHLVLKGRELGQAKIAALLTAILGERDFLRLPPGQRDVDLRHRVDIASSGKRDGTCG